MMQLIRTGQAINLMMTMLETNATMVVCHPASKLTWITGLFNNLALMLFQ